MKKLSVTMTGKEKLLGWIYYPIQLLVLPTAITIVNLYIGSPLSELWTNFLYFAINFLCVIAIFHRFLLGNSKNALHAILRCLRSAGVGFVAYWFLNYVVSIIVVLADPEFFNVNDAYISEIAQGNFAWMAVGTVLLVPLAEEVLYRGLIFGQLYNRSRVAAYLVSILVFAAVHVVGYIGLYAPTQLLLCVLQYLPAGLCLGWAYVNADSIWAPILIHMTINLLGVLAMR